MRLAAKIFNAEPRQKWIGFIVFAILGTIGNALPLPLFFGVDIIFGSIASLIAIAWLGPRFGLAVTIIAASYTYTLWNHPYAAIVFVAEGVFVSLVLNRLRGNLALASTLFWIVIGIPLHAILYHYGLGMDWLGTQLATVKQATFGIFNSIVASLVICYAPFFSKMRLRDDNRIPLYQHIFNIFVGVALVPAAILLVFDGRSGFNDIERSAMSRLETVSTGVVQATVGFLEQQKKAVLSVAVQIEKSGKLDPVQVQPLVDGLRHIWPDYYGAFVADEMGTSLAFDPLINSKGERTIGLNFSDRDYFKELKAGQTAVHVSDIFLARGGLFVPIFNITAPIRIRGEFKGIVGGGIKVQNILDKMHELLQDSFFQATLVDRSGNVVISDNKEFPSLTPFSPKTFQMVEGTAGRFYYHLMGNPNAAPMSRWNNSSLGMTMNVPVSGGWTLYVEQPMAPLRAVLYDRYIRNMAFLFGLSLVILFGSMLIAQWIARPLSKLSSETTNLPERLELKESIVWPESSILELDRTTENFKSMVAALTQRFLQLETSQKQLEQAKNEAEAANRMKSSFLANMSHEIRTPLGIMIGFTDLITDDSVPREQKIEFAKGLKRNATQLSILIDDILDLSKVEAGHFPLEFSELSIRQMIGDLVADFTPRASDKGLYLTTSIAADVPDIVISDSSRVKQILVNLIGNAVKFTDSGSIDLKVKYNETEIYVDVVDHGLGISEEDQNKLFKPFSQGDESLTRRFGGTGLGLALSKRLSVLLGGDLVLAESRTGEGSRFRLTLPIECSTKNIYERPVVPVTQEPPKSMDGLSILLVEDSVDNQALITHMLERNGAKVEVANNGEEAILQASQGAHDLVLMDLQMPVMDGLTAAKILRARSYTKPMIALTAHAMAEFREKCLQAGFNDHVSKPIHFDDLFRVISSLNVIKTADRSSSASRPQQDLH